MVIVRRKYPTAADVGEFGLIARITERLGMAGDAQPARRIAGRLLVGPGDDAAVLAPGAATIASVDLLIEGPDFRRDWSGAFDLGAKSVAVGLADIAAMGAVPTALLIGLSVPADLPLAWIEELADGVADECRVAGATVVGGDVSGGERVGISVTALGDAAGVAPVRRGGARPGDLVVVSAATGRSAAGLAALTAGRGDDPDLATVVAAHRRPRVDYAAGRRLAQAGATAMLDVSDGLLADLGHIAAASGVRIDLDRAKLPVADEVAAAAAILGADPMPWVLTGGEDHAFAATLPPAATVMDGIHVIGAVGSGSGITVDGSPAGSGQPPGWRHF